MKTITKKHLMLGKKKKKIGLPWWLSGKQSACRRETHGCDP